MAVVTVAITGHVLAPDGSAPISGRLVVKLSTPGSTLDGSESVRVATEVTEDLGTGGVVSFALVPNDVITPSGTYYLATFVAQLASGRRVQWAEKWQLTSADLTLDIGAVPRIDAVPGVALQQDTAWPEAAAASVAAAAASELAAATSEAAAAASETTATAAANQATAARDLAIAGVAIYANTTAGLAATASGGYFAVPASSPYDDFLILYLDNAGTAVEVGRSLGPGSLYQAAALDYAWHVQDAIGNVSIGVKPDGTFVFHTAEATASTVETQTTNRQIIGGADAVEQFSGRFVKALTDAAGNVALGVRPDGTVEVASLQVGEVNGQRNNPAAAARNWGAEISHVLSYGQSLALGSNATPLQTSAQRHDSLRFVGGVRPSDGASYASLVALVETQSGVYYETPVAGACEAFHDFAVLEDGLAYSAHSSILLGSAAGQSGQSLLGLSKGSGNYTTLMDHVTNGLARAVALGKSYKVLGVLWSQGEADADLGTSAATYRSQLQTLITDLNTDIKAITGQTDDVHLIGYQFSSWKVYAGATWEIPLALLAEANSNALFHLVGPNYHLTHAADNVHLTGLSSKHLGGYYGRALKRVAVNGGEPPLLQPVAAHRSGAVAVLKFDVPVAPLVLDTTTVTAATNSGFELVDSGGSPLTLSSVALLGDNRVKLTAASTIPAGAMVRYAASGTGTTGPVDGPRGNLRDSAGDREALDPDHVCRPLHNWCVHFEFAL